MDEIVVKPIGVIRSPYTSREGMPIQPTFADAAMRGTVEVFPQYREGLNDLEKFSHVLLIYFFHRSEGYSLRVKPFLDDNIRGLFSTRAPRRPNALGVSVVPLHGIENTILHVSRLDILDGTPLLDIKPYVPLFDEYKEVKTGWLQKKLVGRKRAQADDRFSDRNTTGESAIRDDKEK